MLLTAPLLKGILRSFRRQELQREALEEQQQRRGQIQPQAGLFGSPAPGAAQHKLLRIGLAFSERQLAFGRQLALQPPVIGAQLL